MLRLWLVHGTPHPSAAPAPTQQSIAQSLHIPLPGIHSAWVTVVWHTLILLLALALCVVGFVVVWSMRRGRRTEPGVVGYVGLWGTGKTLALVRDGITFLRDPKCIEVWASFHLRDPKSETNSKKFHYLDPDQFGEILPTLRIDREKARAGFYTAVLIDEAGLLLPSRVWEKLPVSFLSLVALGRKYGLVFRWATQSEKRTDTVLREVTTHVWKCNAWALFNYLWCIQMRCYLPGEAENGDKAFGSLPPIAHRRLWRWQMQEAFHAYDTLEAVNLADHVQPTGGTSRRKVASAPVTNPSAVVVAASEKLAS